MKKINVFGMQCFVQLLFVWIIISVINAAPAIDTVWHQHENIVQSGLYGPTDHVVILNSTNLKNSIYGSENAWVVEFYANWCPHCQRFSAKWKTLAHSIDNWKDIVNIGVFDCATVENTPFCRDYKVMTVPTIKYFSPYSQMDELGLYIKKSEIVEVMRRKIIDTLKNDTTHNVSWPNLAPLKDLQPNDVFAGQPMNIKYSFIIFEKDNSYLGSIVILDFHNISQISVQRVSSANEELCNAFKVTEFPTLIAVERENSISNLNLSTPSRTSIYNAIKNYLKTKNIELDMLDIIEDSEIEEKYKPKKNINRNNMIKLKDDNIYQVDLEKALHYSLEQEISLSQNITGEKLEALKNYLQVLAGYFPMKFGSSQYLKNIYNTVKNKTTIDDNEFRNLIALIKNESNQSKEFEWIGCKSSLPHLRRYTCGLWTMFHTLTVQYAIATDENHLNTDVGEKVILAIYGYAKYFFGCSHCAEHFVYMAEKNNITEHRTADQSVLWLWKAHNEVNLRLANDATEDPEYPKIQYPSKVHCPACRNDNETWNEPEVLKYLKEKYGGSRIKYDLIS
ncbi:hypothetical protein PV328_001571 [Microctonus aethiopoides]|uniref:Sulfhydryl oxidase n=1 Tax=Microctonus aethiopoides TaxID=144406 RepID=A0AA39FX95_9HYME|nr:hypothetical protein PV328_001571 [Microctonus aethiopoides]